MAGWRRRPAGVCALCGDQKTRRRDAGATQELRAQLIQRCECPPIKIGVKIRCTSRTGKFILNR